jgi:hypothetical protein
MILQKPAGIRDCGRQVKGTQNQPCLLKFIHKSGQIAGIKRLFQSILSEA